MTRDVPPWVVATRPFLGGSDPDGVGTSDPRAMTGLHADAGLLRLWTQPLTDDHERSHQ
jgi:hypothetical protein